MFLDIKGNALDDGPGIRSVVFFKGCPLSCVWCQNPESRRSIPELSFDAVACIAGCTRCLHICPKHALDRRNPDFVDRSACDVCFACVDACPSGVLSRVGHPASLQDLMRILRRDKSFYDASGGGVTFSGGEPTLHMKFLGELAAACRADGIHTLLETSGQFRWERFERNVLPQINTIYYDLKLFDSDAHREFCGVSNDRILENFARLAALSLTGEVELLARIPLVPEITATETNVLAIGNFLLAHGINRVRLLDYNPTWVDKITKLGARNDFAQQAAMRTWLPKSVVATIRAKLGERGITTL
jgi:pyruvate formate lyase activating enzyme